MKVKIDCRKMAVFNRPNHNRYVIEIISEYNKYLNLISKSLKWADNGLRVCSKVIGVPNGSKEKGLALENELGRLLDGMDYEYGLQVIVGEYQIADAVIRVGNGMFLRIEAKYVDKKFGDTLYEYKNILEWGNKYRDKPEVFHPYTILYLNYDYYKILSKEFFKNCYRNGLIIANFRTLPKIISRMERGE